MKKNHGTRQVSMEMKEKRTIRERDEGGLFRLIRQDLIIVILITGVVLLGSTISPLYAQTYPTKPIRLILPMSPGGTVDTVSRLISPKLGELLGQPVVCENRPGAGGNVGMEYVAKSKPDGYTMVMGTIALTTSPGLYKRLNYDPINDLAPVAMVSRHHFALLIHPRHPFKTIRELVDYARANPGRLNYSSSGIGGPGHLTGELLKSLTKIDIVHVPYKGGGPATTALLGGEVDMSFVGVSGALPQIKAGRVKALAVLSDKRDPALPDVQTTKEGGVDDFEIFTWHGILCAAGTPREIINRLNTEWNKMAKMPDIVNKLRVAGFDTLSGTPEMFEAFLKKEVALWNKVIKEAGIIPID
jgi:tripartite-type tricarboxylate transporter receptor subunit TctC